MPLQAWATWESCPRWQGLFRTFEKQGIWIITLPARATWYLLRPPRPQSEAWVALKRKKTNKQWNNHRVGTELVNQCWPIWLNCERNHIWTEVSRCPVNMPRIRRIMCECGQLLRLVLAPSVPSLVNPTGLTCQITGWPHPSHGGTVQKPYITC